MLAKERGIPRATIEAGAAARVGKKLSPEHIEKVRQSAKERMTPEARSHLSSVNLGIKHTEESIALMKEIKRKNSGRPVTVHGVDYGSIAEAAEANGIDPSLMRWRLKNGKAG